MGTEKKREDEKAKGGGEERAGGVCKAGERAGCLQGGGVPMEGGWPRSRTAGVRRAPAWHGPLTCCEIRGDHGRSREFTCCEIAETMAVRVGASVADWRRAAGPSSARLSRSDGLASAAPTLGGSVRSHAPSSSSCRRSSASDDDLASSWAQKDGGGWAPQMMELGGTDWDGTEVGGRHTYV